LRAEVIVLSTHDLAEAFERNRRIVAGQTADLSHAQSLYQPPFGANCLNWTVGHLVVHRDKTLAILGGESVLDPESFERYNKESEPITGDGPAVMTLAALRSALDETQSRLTAALEATDDDDLTAELQVGERTMPLAARLHFLYFHDTYHAAHVELLAQMAKTES
jgi:uncharacterized damage-inducible protein DinB